MRDQLLAYLLDDIPPEERQRIEHRLRNDPIWQHELERLRTCMQEYADDPKNALPPSDLVHRTCSYVQHNAGVSPITIPESNANAHSICHLSFLDLAVGGAALLAVAMMLLPALHDTRETGRRLACQNNLQQLGVALAEYAETYRQGLPPVEPNENAGIFAVKLAEKNLLSREQLSRLLVCPSSQLASEVFTNQNPVVIPTPQQLERMTANELARIRKTMAGSYAYRLGYRDTTGAYHQFQFTQHHTEPIMADTPSFEVAGFQSANHGACGQNVLYQDLSCRYLRKSFFAQDEDHPYLNDDRQHAAGRHAHDVVLGRSEVIPGGALQKPLVLIPIQ